MFYIVILEVVGGPVVGREVGLPAAEAPLGVCLRQQLPQPPLVWHGRPQVAKTLQHIGLHSPVLEIDPEYFKYYLEHQIKYLQRKT